ncbi:DUF262 domain-containing protein [Metapseudomonas otitidis]|uniref:DUF262 domain-containing protein n=1 Tax=Metapseudomonas otitidis TaxID=319939 RepID=UPI0013F5DCCD|nr:DUF262 domain-containing protein [Pseudomonas otitidis]
MSKRDPKPEVLRLEELALLVKSGEIKLPRFQRPFVWKRPDMLKLLDSIYKGYPIGSLLLWNSSQRLKSERDIAGLHVDDKPAIYPTNYLLDGQQRLTTLCGALFWEGNQVNSIWNIHFDLENEIFVYPKDQNLVTMFPLNKLMNTRDFIHQCMKFEHHDNKIAFTDRAERVLRSIKDYKIAVVMIGDMSIEEVAPIFERINSTGRKLTIVDLMMAATWSNGFDLSAEIETTKSICETLGFSGISEQAILRSIAASADLGVNKEDIQKLRNLNPAQLKTAASNCTAAFERAVTWMMENLPVRDASYLPYGLYLTHLVEIFRIVNTPTEQQSHEMLSWFWYTSSTLYFGGASTGQISRDLTITRDFAAGHRATLYARNTIDINRLLFDKFNLKNASSTTLALLLFYKKNRCLPLPLASEKDSKIFMKLPTRDIEELNISVVLDLYKTKSEIESSPNLDDQLLDNNCIDAISSKNNEAFIESRAKIISELLKSLTGCQVIFNYDAGLLLTNDSDYSYAAEID